MTDLSTREISEAVIREGQISGLTLRDATYSSISKVSSEIGGIATQRVACTHFHQEAVFCVPLEGTCEELFAGSVRKYETFVSKYQPPNFDHSLILSSGAVRAFTVDVPAHWVQRASEYSLKLDESLSSRGRLTWLMLRLYSEFLMSDAASALAIEGLVLEMLAEVSRFNVRQVTRIPPRWMSQVIELLAEGFHERMTVAEIAAAVSIHPVHLAREFRRFNRCTVGEYIRQLRIAKACRELGGTTESLSAIAAATGFADQSHFCRTFKRLVGMTPLEYRAIVNGRQRFRRIT